MYCDLILISSDARETQPRIKPVAATAAWGRDLDAGRVYGEPMLRRSVDLCSKTLDRSDYLITLARLSILDRLAGWMPEAPTDRIRWKKLGPLRSVRHVGEAALAIQRITRLGLDRMDLGKKA